MCDILAPVQQAVRIRPCAAVAWGIWALTATALGHFGPKDASLGPEELQDQLEAARPVRSSRRAVS